MEIKRKIFLYALLFLPFWTFGQLPTQVCFMNKGAMYIAPINNSPEKAALYISKSIQVKGGSSIYQVGITSIGGNFYQDATTNVFYKNNEVFPSTGKIVFANNVGAQHQITTKEVSLDNFNRKDYFIAFPEIEIETTDELLVPAKMGIDAIRILTHSQSGKMRLESKVYGTGIDAKIYDASLRITGSETSEQLVPSGAVIVERDLSLYRLEDGTTGAGPLFAFASPFKNLRSGYFAGNWVRKLLEGENGHVRFVYGNQSNNGAIILSQYITEPTEHLIPGKGYLVKLRKMNFPYSDLMAAGGLTITGDTYENYNKSKFIFDGNIYQIGNLSEQLFADNILFQRSINESGTRDTTINWIIGNSYSAPISIQKLINIMGSSSLVFDPNIYVFPAGSTSYQIYRAQPNPSTMQVIDISEIPAMSYFMIRLDKSRSQVGTFTLLKNDILMHGNSSHSLRNVNQTYNNEIVFRVSPESNYNIYDLAGIGLRKDGIDQTNKYDILKAGENNNELFQLYTMAIDGKMLSANILPETAERVNLYFSPGTTEGMFRLEATRMESLATEGLWLEDLKERKVIDLLNSDGSYTFEVNKNDNAGRFVVHFKKITTGSDRIGGDNFLQVYCLDNQIVLKGLMPSDLHSKIQIFDMQGHKIYEQIVSQTPETSMNVNMTKGVYIIRLLGNRAISLSFKK